MGMVEWRSVTDRPRDGLLAHGRRRCVTGHVRSWTRCGSPDGHRGPRVESGPDGPIRARCFCPRSVFRGSSNSFIERPSGMSSAEFDRALYLARMRAEAGLPRRRTSTVTSSRCQRGLWSIRVSWSRRSSPASFLTSRTSGRCPESPSSISVLPRTRLRPGASPSHSA